MRSKIMTNRGIDGCFNGNEKRRWYCDTVGLDLDQGGVGRVTAGDMKTHCPSPCSVSRLQEIACFHSKYQLFVLLSPEARIICLPVYCRYVNYILRRRHVAARAHTHMHARLCMWSKEESISFTAVKYGVKHIISWIETCCEYWWWFLFPVALSD